MSAVGTQVLHFKMYKRRYPFVWEHIGCYGRDCTYGRENDQDLMYPTDRILLVCQHVKEQCDIANDNRSFLMRAQYHRLHCVKNCAHNAFNE